MTLADPYTPGHPGVWEPPNVVGAGRAVVDNPYRRSTFEETDMANTTETVSWTQFMVAMGLLVTVMIAVIGGGFSWLHSDMGDVKKNLDEITKQVSDVRVDVGKTGTKLDIITQELQKRR
jgi:hypothetical protein